MISSDMFKVLGIDVGALADTNFEIRGISIDSRNVAEDYCFIAFEGTHSDGHDFIPAAVEKGARVIVCKKGRSLKRDYPGKKVYFIEVDSPREAAGIIADAFFGYPGKKIKIIGITGTNGKTTVSYLIKHIFERQRMPAGLIGTIQHIIADQIIPAKNTTPDAVTLHNLLRLMVEHDLGYAVMEVSSHALAQCRVSGIGFRTAVFTNLTHDHLDYHHDKEQYFAAKSRLFVTLSAAQAAVINFDDAYGVRLKKMTAADITGYGIKNPAAAVRAQNIVLEPQGTRFTIVTPNGVQEVRTALIGRHNVYNILAAVSVGLREGLSLESMAEALETITNVPGRLEKISSRREFSVYVDYAHTDDALKNVLTALRELKPRRIITVFGCGGDRDKTKRPLMGKVASENSEMLVITNDNPRSESPERIIEDIKTGLCPGFGEYEVIPDREEAIAWALSQAQAHDFVLIAGKGHETYQIFKDRTVSFDDRQVVRNLLQAAGDKI
ncbi:MAG: UDP-N-acetylmuramoyl-L-alanyl-D-glutamate--2,6-diaminopimelate ligase [Candidatus Omnitrophica bacterium]|nr:UDP-N-acetylmuramoyl-L-alanyl-D-glutamate--2,6-diaminopimelate ligase [Candidatus Omnitrophota bacterium]MBU4478008.1 UDP-N-acetylmuramoyl-L-alanyl-D-glutamate--2,6-diaminopimelate ligase [Candidatus Omnitrophota bacterium]MCG2703941.1 UDP-N-acetylmuramoyl-L-alanyl-D-glutamate--2,6-diaminopimelate ligase [Candidatus Omnitrophota bacterium]